MSHLLLSQILLSLTRCVIAHFVIKHFKKQYTSRSRDDDDDEQDESVSYGDIRVTPPNGEKYLSFQVGNLPSSSSLRPWITSSRC